MLTSLEQILTSLELVYFEGDRKVEQAAQSTCAFLLGDTQNPPGHFPLQPGTCASRGVGLDDLQKSLPTPVILWFSNNVAFNIRAWLKCSVFCCLVYKIIC